MASPSPRYLAEHLLMPQFLQEKGARAVLSAIEAKDGDFFAPVWNEVGIRYAPQFLYAVQSPFRVGVMTFPKPQDVAEAHLGAFVGRTDASGSLRFFLWEESFSPEPSGEATVIGEWTETEHASYGAGPRITGNLSSDAWEFTKRVLAILRG